MRISLLLCTPLIPPTSYCSANEQRSVSSHTLFHLSATLASLPSPTIDLFGRFKKAERPTPTPTQGSTLSH